jgi:hypothetical protein
MLKVPELPAPYAVAVLALRTQPAPVYVVVLVASVAARGRLVLIKSSCVATLTGCCSMLAEEWVFCVSIVIEGDCFPVVLVVTFLALRPKVGSVNVVFLMTGRAVGGCLLFVKRTFVASVAFRLPVVALQRIRGIAIMLKEHEFPVPFSVTTFAFLAETALMLVVLLVAGVAIDGSLIPIQEPLVTGLALGRDMPST